MVKRRWRGNVKRKIRATKESDETSVETMSETGYHASERKVAGQISTKQNYIKGVVWTRK